MFELVFLSVIFVDGGIVELEAGPLPFEFRRCGNGCDCINAIEWCELVVCRSFVKRSTIFRT